MPGLSIPRSPVILEVMNGLFEPDSRPTPSGKYAVVAPERGLDSDAGLTYAIPGELADLRAGDRVIVPLGRGNRPTAAYVLSVQDRTEFDTAKIKSVASRDEAAANLPSDLMELAQWIAQYYCCPLGMVLQTMLPAAVKHGVGLQRRMLVEPSEPIPENALSEFLKQHKLPAKQRDVLTTALQLAAVGKMPIDMKDLAHHAGAKTAGPVRRLVDKGLLRTVESHQVRALWADRDIEPPRDFDLNDDQRRAVEAVTASLTEGFSVQLLHGVTGSGKTEVYMRAIEPIVEQGGSAVVLVPEIALTPQTCGRFIGRFGKRVEVAVLHSGLTASQRHAQWRAIRDGKARVIVGARSAVFAPAQKLGLIVVDEEHDTSYKQDQLPRYHGRDVAIKRAQMLGIPLVIGSATPSLESYCNATQHRTYRLLELPRRVAEQRLPKVEIVDMTGERQRRYRATAGKGAGVHLLSLHLEQALHQTLDDGGQAMLLLNRRGYANWIACPDHQCGWMMHCDHCDAQMVYHLHAKIPTGGLVRCHYCGFENRLPRLCQVCGKKVTVFGLGTQRVEQELAAKFPDTPALRMDSDAMRSGADYHEALERFRSGQSRLLLGTQMIAKGLDFPNVRLVGVISADTALNLPDFRASERTFQLISQVAGRSGRSSAGGRVIVQTFNPTNPAIRFAAQHDYPGFARWELANRAEHGLPPTSRMARLVLRHRDMESCEKSGRLLAAALQKLDEREETAARIGPSHPPAIARIAGHHRRQIEILAEDAAALQRLLGAARREGLIKSDAHMAVDVDPVALM